VLVKELMNFRVKITAHANDTYDAWREETHDDLVLALAMACWYRGQMMKRHQMQLFIEDG
jgi:hypothetical protein